MTYEDILSQFLAPQLIGEGGQKRVFAIEHPRYGPSVLKIGTFQYPATLERIRREFELLRSLDCPSFPKIYELNVVDDHRFYSLEQQLDGQPLERLLDKFADPRQALNILRELVGALSVLWARRVIHRDVKPGNIIIGRDGARLYVIDLGIARLLDEISLTQTLAMRGPCTPVYAAPEQLLNRKREINHRCDQFACGIVLAQLLLRGDHPFEPCTVGSGESTVANILSGCWASQRLSAQQMGEVRALLDTMLARHPYQRFRTPAMLATAIDRALEGLPE
jgi:serine/threonine protein kinase